MNRLCLIYCQIIIFRPGVLSSFLNLHIRSLKEQILYWGRNNITGKIMHINCYQFMLYPEFHYSGGLVPDKLF